MRIFGGACVFILSAVLTTAVPNCADDFDLALERTKGNKEARQNAARSFGNTDSDCTNPGFQREMIAGVPFPDAKDDKKECYRLGYEQGIADFMGAMSDRCDGPSCLTDGTAIGNWGGILFCDGQVENPPTPGCKGADAVACQAKFNEYVKAVCSTKEGQGEFARRFCTFGR